MIAGEIREALEKTATLMRKRGWSKVRVNRRDEIVTGHRTLRGNKYKLRIASFHVLYVYVRAQLAIYCNGRQIWKQTGGDLPRLEDVLGNRRVT